MRKVNGAGMDRAEFYGYVTAKLETIHEDIKEIKTNHSSLDERVGKIENKCAQEQVIIANFRNQLKKDAIAAGSKSSVIISVIVTTVGAIVVALIQFWK